MVKMCTSKHYHTLVKKQIGMHKNWELPRQPLVASDFHSRPTFSCRLFPITFHAKLKLPVLPAYNPIRTGNFCGSNIYTFFSQWHLGPPHQRAIKLVLLSCP